MHLCAVRVHKVGGIAADRNRLWKIGHTNTLLHILGNIDQHRTGPSRSRNIKRLFDNAGNILNAIHEIIVLRNLPRHLNNRGLLKRIAANNSRWDLTRNRNKRHGVHFGIGQPRDQIGSPRSRRCHTHTNFARGFGISLSRKNFALFVPAQHNLDIGAREGLVHLHTGPSGIAKENFDPLADETFNQNIGTTHFARSGCAIARYRSLGFARHCKNLLCKTKKPPLHCSDDGTRYFFDTIPPSHGYKYYNTAYNSRRNCNAGCGDLICHNSTLSFNEARTYRLSPILSRKLANGRPQGSPLQVPFFCAFCAFCG